MSSSTDLQVFAGTWEFNDANSACLFAGPILETVLDNIHDAVTSASRPMTIVFLNSGRAQPIIDQRPWMQPTRSITSLHDPCQLYQVEAA